MTVRALNRAAVKQELEWQDLRAAIACLSAIASLDQGIGADDRLRQIEERLGTIRPNGHASSEGRGHAPSGARP